MTLGPSEWNLPTDSTSQKRPKPEEGQGLGMGEGGMEEEKKRSICAKTLPWEVDGRE